MSTAPPRSRWPSSAELAAVGHIRAWAQERNAENIAVARSYVAGTGPFPERAAVLAVVGGFITDFDDMVGTWAEWATTVIEDWPDDPRLAPPAWYVLEEVAHRGRSRPDTRPQSSKSSSARGV